MIYECGTDLAKPIQSTKIITDIGTIVFIRVTVKITSIKM